MRQVISTENIPIKLWLDDIDDNALTQAKNLANLPFVYKHIAIMPDAHLGYGMPIGGVIAARDVIIPHAVGSDIGCGMIAVKTSLMEITRREIKEIMGGSSENKGGIRSRIPLGFKHHSRKQDGEYMPTIAHKMPVVLTQYESALKQIGTLGGGNHFIEIQKGSDGYIWLMVHSGSRNIGFKVAKHYNDLSIELNDKWHSSVPKKWELAFLPLDSKEGIQYKSEMDYCVEFAFQSRSLMMERIKNSVSDVFPDTLYNDGINIAHNYAAMEHHFGENIMIHRKGATMACKGQLGIIPGSQGTSSYIVQGLGNPDSFESCSHGAGRRMGRKQAQRELNLNDERKRLDDLGVIHSVRGQRDLDEAAGAYKDIYTVMANQEDLVEVVVELKPLAVIKG